MNCIIIDDDKLSRLVLEKYIQQTDNLDLQGSFKNAIEAANFIQDNTDTDLIFLDVEMPEMTGIEFLNSLKKLPQIIIISAKQKYALEAFEYDVTDYLLKPINYPRFLKSIDKVKSRLEENIKESEQIDSFFIKSGNSLVRIKYEEILWVEALENYVGINTFNQKHTIHFTMKAIESKLPVDKFKRVHRSYIVHLKKIDLIEENTIMMKTKKGVKTIPIGKSYRDDLMNQINLVIK